MGLMGFTYGVYSRVQGLWGLWLLLMGFIIGFRVYGGL